MRAVLVFLQQVRDAKHTFILQSKWGDKMKKKIEIKILFSDYFVIYFTNIFFSWPLSAVGTVMTLSQYTSYFTIIFFSWPLSAVGTVKALSQYTSSLFVQNLESQNFFNQKLFDIY